jgi:hypothetical protein
LHRCCEMVSFFLSFFLSVFLPSFLSFRSNHFLRFLFFSSPSFAPERLLRCPFIIFLPLSFLALPSFHHLLSFLSTSFSDI